MEIKKIIVIAQTILDKRPPPLLNFLTESSFLNSSLSFFHLNFFHFIFLIRLGNCQILYVFFLGSSVVSLDISLTKLKSLQKEKC